MAAGAILPSPAPATRHTPGDHAEADQRHRGRLRASTAARKFADRRRRRAFDAVGAVDVEAERRGRPRPAGCPLWLIAPPGSDSWTRTPLISSPNRSSPAPALSAVTVGPVEREVVLDRRRHVADLAAARLMPADRPGAGGHEVARIGTDRVARRPAPASSRCSSRAAAGRDPVRLPVTVVVQVAGAYGPGEAHDDGLARAAPWSPASSAVAIQIFFMSVSLSPS